jgi:outer membrane protein TolC
MIRICLSALAAVSLIASGCQHLPPQPLDMHGIHTALQERELEVEPVRAYANALAAEAGAAEPFDASDGLSLREAQAVALWYNPNLRIARIEEAQAQAVTQVSGRWPDPELGISAGKKRTEGEGTSTLALEDRGETLSYSRTKPNLDRAWIVAGSLSITVPISGRIQAQRDLSDTIHEVARLRAIEAEWQTLAQVRAAWLRWSASVERVKLLDQHLLLLSEFSETSAALAEAGELPPSSARLFDIERIHRAADRDREEALATETHAAILEQLGLLPDAPVTLIPHLDAQAQVPAEWADPASHPTLARLRAAYQEAEDRLRLELRKQYPDITFSPTYTDEQDETSLVLGLGFPIPVWNANRQGIAEAAGARDVARAQVEAEYHRLLVQRAQAEAAIRGTRAQRARLLDEIAPLIDAQMEESLSLLKIGEMDVLIFYETLKQALETKEALLEASLAEALAAARLIALNSTDTKYLESQVEIEP